MQVTDTVRIVRTAGLIRSVLFATILSIQLPHPDDDGTNGEPTITIGYMDPENVRLLGGPDWHKAYKRITGVRHVSHSDVQQGKTDYCYTEVLPADGGPVHLQGLNMDIEDGPAAEAAEARSTVGTIVYINHSNDLEVFHGGDDLFRVHFNGEDHDFTDLFSARVFVDAQPKASQPVAKAPKPTDAEILSGIGAAATNAPTRTVEIGEYPPEENITEPFSVKIDGEEVERFLTREAAQEYIDKLLDAHKSLSQTSNIENLGTLVQKAEADSNPPQMTPESIAAQNEHDRATGNVNEANQTPAEALAAEQQQ